MMQFAIDIDQIAFLWFHFDFFFWKITYYDLYLRVFESNFRGIIYALTLFRSYKNKYKYTLDDLVQFSVIM